MFKKFLIPPLSGLLVLAGCTPVVEKEDVSLSIDMDGEVVLLDEGFDVSLNVDFEDSEAELSYVVDVVAQNQQGITTVLARLPLTGESERSVSVQSEQPGEARIQAVLKNVDSEGSAVEPPVVSSNSLKVVTVDARELSIEFSNPPEIWLLDEPFHSEVLLSQEIQDLPVDVVFELDSATGPVEFDRFASTEERQDFELFPSEGVVNLRIIVASGGRELASSEMYDFEVMTPQGMIQEFFYDDRQVAQQSDGETTFNWIRDTAFPGIFNPTPEQIETLLEEFDDGQYTTTDPIWESVRENTEDFNPQPSDRIECFQIPEDWPPVPGRHFMFDYQRPYRLFIGDSQVGEGTDRGTRHLTFYDGRAYQWTYQC